MIRYLRGILVEVGETEIVVEVQGVGYGVNIPVSVAEELPSVGEEIKIYTYFSVREDAMQLFGFLNREDLQMYRLLISVSGVGPKAGLAILGSLGGESLRFAVMSDDARTIARAPGIGPKTAQKIILELKDKMDWEELSAEALPGDTGSTPAAGGGAHSSAAQDAVEALVALGYPRAEALRAVRSAAVAEDAPVEEVLKQSLKNL